MAVYFWTEQGSALLKKFNDRIAQRDPKGKITTWERSDDGEYYTHKASEWKAEAWFKATVDAKRLRFNIIKPKNKNVSSSAYAYYHGHLIETFLNHFDKDFSSGEATALPSSNDVVGS
jgi:hypothetical protein